MRLAKADEEGSLEGAKSIRQAREMLPKQKPRGSSATQETDDQTDEETEDEAEEESQEIDEDEEEAEGGIIPHREDGSPDLENLLPSVGADEVFKVIRVAWTREELNRLAEFLDTYLYPVQQQAA
jgi:hypothetical protein